VNENLPPPPLLEKRQRDPLVKEITVRLTLRTLLAYLDDTLEPLEIKNIGLRVSDNPTAQELIARIKQVTRRRRITTPPATGPNSFDPNLVAEYLDERSILSAEQVAEVEKICLESDVHLAEVAACHQILTLVLGEPAAVPPTAKERMYGLVHGREAIPFRRAATARGDAASPTSGDANADEMFLLGLPFYRRGSWLRWALPVAAVVLFTIVAVALWQSIQPAAPTPVAQKSKGRGNEGVADNSAATNPQPESKGTNADNNALSPEKSKQSETATPPPSNPQEQKQTNGSKTGSQPELRTDSTSTKEPNAPPATGRLAPPSTEHVVVGKYEAPDSQSAQSVLLQRKDDKSGWSRLKPAAQVASGNRLVCLPGYVSEVRLDCGLHLLLRGNLPEFAPAEPAEIAKIMYPLQDCALVLHNPKDTAADLTLLRGRLFLSNSKTNETLPLVVRLRFEDKVWDLSLYAGAEAVIDLIRSRNEGEPMADLHLTLIKGNAALILEGEKYPDLKVPGRAGFLWNSLNPSKFGRLDLRNEDVEFGLRVVFPKNPAITTEEAKKMEQAMKALQSRMSAGKDPLTVIREVLEQPGIQAPHQHRLAILCLGAMGEVQEIMNILGRRDELNAPDRVHAIVSLRRWLDHDRDQERKLLDFLPSALGYTLGESKKIMELLRDPSFDQFNSKDYYRDMARDLTSERVAIAELARWRLALLAINMCKLKMPKLEVFNAARPASERSAAMQEVIAKVDEGRLPPPDPDKPASPGAKGGTGAKTLK
jgi:hypothetical protein